MGECSVGMKADFLEHVYAGMREGVVGMKADFREYVFAGLSKWYGGVISGGRLSSFKWKAEYGGDSPCVVGCMLGRVDDLKVGGMLVDAGHMLISMRVKDDLGRDMEEDERKLLMALQDEHDNLAGSALFKDGVDRYVFCLERLKGFVEGAVLFAMLCEVIEFLKSLHKPAVITE